jgi:hypothetical protein
MDVSGCDCVFRYTYIVNYIFCRALRGLESCLCAAVTWTCRASSTPLKRSYYTSVIGAAGAIYVVGGSDGQTAYNDVWVSTEGGADRTRAGTQRYSRANGRGGALQEHSRGACGFCSRISLRDT